MGLPHPEKQSNTRKAFLSCSEALISLWWKCARRGATTGDASLGEDMRPYNLTLYVQHSLFRAPRPIQTPVRARRSCTMRERKCNPAPLQCWMQNNYAGRLQQVTAAGWSPLYPSVNSFLARFDAGYLLSWVFHITAIKYSRDSIAHGLICSCSQAAQEKWRKNMSFSINTAAPAAWRHCCPFLGETFPLGLKPDSHQLALFNVSIAATDSVT